MNVRVLRMSLRIWIFVGDLAKARLLTQLDALTPGVVFRVFRTFVEA